MTYAQNIPISGHSKPYIVLFTSGTNQGVRVPVVQKKAELMKNIRHHDRLANPLDG